MHVWIKSYLLSCCPASLRCLPFMFQVRIVAAQNDAHPNASRVQVKRLFLVIFLRARLVEAPRAIRFLRYRFALSTWPAFMTRSGDRIDRNHAVHQHRKERPCRIPPNQQRKSACSRSPRPSGETSVITARSIPSRSNGATRTNRAPGRAQIASAKAIRFCWRRLRIKLTARSSSFVRLIATRSNKANNRIRRPSELRLRRAVSCSIAGHLGGYPVSFLPVRPQDETANRITFVSLRRHSPVCTWRIRLAAGLILRFSRCCMLDTNKAGSKLCASLTRHATVCCLRRAQQWFNLQGEPSPPLHPPVRLAEERADV